MAGKREEPQKAEDEQEQVQEQAAKPAPKPAPAVKELNRSELEALRQKLQNMFHR
jgi:hypothetical protein